ncbi:hypothetical protein U6U47_12200, partial [Cutibacterium acnes]
MDSLRLAGLLPVVFCGCEGSKIVVCEVCCFSSGDAFADLEVSRPDDESSIVTAAGMGGWFGWLPFGELIDEFVYGVRVCCGLVVDDFLYGSACFSVGECPFGDACAPYGSVGEI